MRISDWSSDVCSSDLPLQFRCIFLRLCRRLRIRALASGAFACAGGLFWLIKFDVLAIEREIHTVAYIGELLGWRRQAECRASRHAIDIDGRLVRQTGDLTDIATNPSVDTNGHDGGRDLEEGW